VEARGRTDSWEIPIFVRKCWTPSKKKDYSGQFLSRKKNLQEKHFSLVLSHFCIGTELDISSTENKHERVEGKRSQLLKASFSLLLPLESCLVLKQGDGDLPVLLIAISS